jgi:YD repeat-containing protein
VIAVDIEGSSYAQTSHIDESSADPISAVGSYSGANGDFGGVSQLRTSLYNAAGTELQESRSYFLVPASGAGTDASNYDPTTYGYDDMGRQRKVKEAHATITRTTYDTLGRTTARWVGTNDSSFPGGEAGTDNMVKVEELTYDAGSSGKNSHLTKRAAFIDGSTSRDTTYAHDLRGNVLLVDNPAGPDQLTKYDNLGRAIAVGAFSSTSSSNDPTSTTTNRLAVSETAYDNAGRVWKSIRHKIDVTDGSDDDTLESLTWYDKDGRVIKTDAEQLTKTLYDNVGRAIVQYTLASTNDSAYADAADVAGDVVLEQHQTAYDKRGLVRVQATVSRYHTDLATPTGSLDPDDADSMDFEFSGGNTLKGRLQVSATWYDEIDRVTTTAQYGTNSGSNFSYSFTPASASDTVLVSKNTYNTDGTLYQVEDPKAIKTVYEYDDAGRRTTVVSNYVNGSPSSTTADDDQIVQYAYTDGLQTSITAYVDGGSNDQVTTYFHGVTKGTNPGDSKIASNALILKVQYPDAADSTNDVVKFAYNAQGQQIWKKDQYVTSPSTAGGNIIETTYDSPGRETSRAVTTPGTGFDTAVLRIETAYTALGQVETVTQYDAASSGSVVDQVKYLYDGWGNVTNFRQDIDGTVGGSGYYDVAYAYEKATTGRNTIRRTSETLGGKTFSLNYASSGSPDVADVSSRVYSIKDGATPLVQYEYLGAGQIVGTMYDEPDVFSRQYGSTAGQYPDLDTLNRVVGSKWTKDLSTDVDFYRYTLTYDRNSNITKADQADDSNADSIADGHVGFDIAYTMDNLNRLTVADEGTFSGGSITSRTRKQEWTLTQTGNWSLDKLDLNGDADWSDPDEWQDSKTFNKVNEIGTRDLDATPRNHRRQLHPGLRPGREHDQRRDRLQVRVGRLLPAPEGQNPGRGAGRRVPLQRPGLPHWGPRGHGHGFGRRRLGPVVLLCLRRTLAHGGHLPQLRHRPEGTLRPPAGGRRRLWGQLVHRPRGVPGEGREHGLDERERRDAGGAALLLPEPARGRGRADHGGGRAEGDGPVLGVRRAVRAAHRRLRLRRRLRRADRNQVQAWINASNQYDVRGDIDLDGDTDSTDKTNLRNNFEGVTLGRGGM